MGLLVLEDARIVAANPSAAASLVVTPMGQQGAQLLAESAQWAQAFTGIGQAWRNAPGAISGLSTELHGEAINSFIASVVADAEFELLTAQPETGRSAAALAVAAERDVAALEGGHEGLHTALAVREPSMVAYLVDMFERTWDRGRPLAHQGSTVSTNPGRRKLRPSMAQAEFSHWRRRRDLNSREV